MRYGFVNGIGGALDTLERAIARLRDCDRIVSLGGLLGGSAPDDLEVWRRFEALGARGLALAGRGERTRAKDRSFPLEARVRLRALESSAVEDGIAILGSPAPVGHASRQEAAATGGAPRIVAPLTITSHGSDTRLWRSAGGLARVHELCSEERLALGGDRLWLELGPTAAGAPTCVVLDPDRATLELRDLSRTEALPVPKAPARQRRRRFTDDRQCLLAV